MIQTGDAEHLVFLLSPRGANSELEPPSREVVDAYRDLGQHSRIAVGVASHHASNTHVLCGNRHRRLERPPLEYRSIWSTGPNRGQVVENPQMIEPRFVG